MRRLLQLLHVAWLTVDHATRQAVGGLEHGQTVSVFVRKGRQRDADPTREHVDEGRVQVPRLDRSSWHAVGRGLQGLVIASHERRGVLRRQDQADQLFRPAADDVADGGADRRFAETHPRGNAIRGAEHLLQA